MSFGLSAGAATLIGAGVGAVGSYLSSKNQADAAASAAAGAQYVPYNVYGPGGSAQLGVDPATGKRVINQQLGGPQQDLYNSLYSGAGQNIFGLNRNAALAGQSQAASQGDILGYYNQLQNTQYNTPQGAAYAAQNFGRIGDVAQGGAANALAGAYNAPSSLGLANYAANQSASLGGQSFNDLAAQRLSLLRQQALPSQEQATNAKFNSLFSRGQLGTTGGALGIGQLQQAQNQQDLGFQANAMDFAQNQFNTNQQLSQGFLSQALGGYGQNQNLALNQGQLAMSGLGQAGQQYGAQLGAYQAGDQSRLSQGQNRLMAAQGLFGFGNELTNQNLNQGLQQIGGAQSFESGLLNQAQLGASVGAQQSMAGANAGALAMKGAGSPFGAALQGIGTGFSNSDAFGKFFQNRAINSGLNSAINDPANADIFSDARLKTNLRPVGKTSKGITVYDFDWKSGGSDRGVMAQEVMQVVPEAVRLDASGYLKVNYSLVGDFV